MARLLLVEDDAGIARPLTGALRAAGHEVVHVTSGTEALRAASDVDAVILDLGLPDLDGVEVCRRLRADHGASLPILVLTARAGELDIVVGLDAGADDYVTKPFRLAELQARLRALLRRAGPERAAVLAAGRIKLDVGARRVWLDELELELTPTEHDLLALLVSHAGEAVTRETIMREVWDTAWTGSTKALDMQISSLRRKLGDDSADPTLIVTLRGVGYRVDR
ncbi:MAG: DNA-binding response OmpR family regulator [Nonlabens sp.]